MNEPFSIDSLSPNSYMEIRDYLYNNLKDILHSNRDIIFICIGTDRCTGDSLGPLIGYKLKNISKNKIHIYGSLETPIHSKNLIEVTNKINLNFDNPYIIAIDSCLGKISNIGKVFIDKKPLQPGLALNKNLPPIGDLSITGIVNIGGNFEFIVLQNTRLYTVMSLADCIYKGIYHFILKVSKEFEYINKPSKLNYLQENESL
ncbi:spore protease YyaC [Clostridium sp.]|uniref:spore protease YyaC n=1 Tax=Clostridium sp. TaxID=1506 RepID=UPI001EB8931C|nr:spore protease YyaC [Clostridium sp.]MBS5886578.1 spore protease YyaC [Clostridium sp.]MDU7243310.1 spore protease YyaC [Clostridium sp.]